MKSAIELITLLIFEDFGDLNDQIDFKHYHNICLDYKKGPILLHEIFDDCSCWIRVVFV